MPALELNSELNKEENEELDLLTTTKLDLLSFTNTSSSSASSFSLSNDIPHPKFYSSVETTMSPLDFVVENAEKSDSTTSTKKRVRIAVEDRLEREYDAALNRYDIQQQVRASIGSLPGDLQFLPQIRLSRKRSWILSKIASFRKGKNPDEPTPRGLKLLDVYKFADKWDIILMIIGGIAALGVGACYPIMFYLYRQILNNLVISSNQTTTAVNITNPCFLIAHDTNTNSPSEAIKHIVNYYVLLGFVSMLLSWIGWTSWIVAAERQIRRIRYKLFRNMLRQEIGWFDLNNAGDLNNRLVTDLDKMKEGMGEKVPDFISLLGRMTGSLIYCFVLGWKLTLVYLSISPLIILSFNLTIKTIVKYTLEEVKAFSSASSIVQEVLQNIRTVTAFHGQEKEEKRFATNLIHSKNIGIRKGIYVGLCQGFSTIVNYAGFAIIAWYGPYLARTECSDYSAGTVLVIFFGSATTTFCIAQLIPNIQNFAEAAASGLNVFDIIERQTKIDASSDEGDKPETITGHIEFRNVTFAYPSREEISVLSNLSLKIPSGKTVALVGSSGCGKSTIIQLIQRFYDPDHGQILLDGKNLTKFNVSWLRSHMGIVSQEPVLFTGSIEENIRFGKSDATDEEVQDAAKMANAHEFIMALPENYKTTSGDKLSGGQKQRVAIARALISNPRILLLDEATSALDNTSERIVQDALEKAKQGRTTIVIAHRLSTIRNADLIIGLDHGEVIEYGSHDELMEKQGLYYELVISQTHKDKEKEEEESESESEEEEEEEDDKPEPLLVTRPSADRRVSKISIFSVGSDVLDENANEIDLAALSKKKKWFHTPFIYKILKFNTREWYWILLGTTVSLVSGASSPLYGLIFANMYSVFGDTNVDEQERASRKYAALGFCIGIVSSLAQFLTSFSFAKSGEALTMRMRKLTFSAILRQEISYFDQESNSTGILVTRISTDASALKGLTGVRIGIILQSISAATIGLIIGFIASWKLTLIVLCYSPILLLSTKINVQKSSIEKKAQDNKRSHVEQGGQHATQAIENIRTVVALHQENHFIDLYEHAFNQEFKRQTRLAHLTAFGTALSASSMYFLQAGCFGYGSTLIDKGEITYTQLYRVYSVVSLTIFSVGRCITIIPDYAKAKAAAIRIMKLNKRESKINPHDESGVILDNVTGNIEFLDVSFRYINRPTLRVLRHFTLNCGSGQTTALVGPSGSGKSTSIALLQRFYDPRRGKILLDGHDIKILNTRWLRSLIGVVQQEPVLFNLSVRDNIAYGDNSREIPQDEIEMAARMANIHDLIITLPQGYETPCGSKGSQLSGGQKQRIAIARALIRNPKILLFDEATSALDNKSERVVQEALDHARTGRTCLTIAHRLTTIQNSEKIAVVNRGKMTEEGTHEQLLRQNGTYARLILAQERTIREDYV